MLRLVPPRFLRDAVLLFATLAMLPWLAVLVAMLAAYHGQLRPEQMQRLQTVGRSVTEPIERALLLGIPLRELRGMDAFLDSVLEEKPFLRSLAILPAPEFGDVPRFQRGTGPQGLEVTVPIRLDGRQVASLQVTEKAGTQEPGYEAAIRDLLVALLVALIAGVQIIRCLLAVLVVEPLLLAERVVDGVAAGRLARLAAGAAAGGELGGLLAAANRLLRRAADRTEDVVIYGREVRAVVSDPAAQGSIDRLLADLHRQVQLDRPLREQQPRHDGALHRLATFFAVVALILQLPELGHWSALWSVDVGIGRSTGTAAVMVNMLVAVLVPGRLWSGLAVFLGRRGSLAVAMGLALSPTLLDWLLPSGFVQAEVPLLLPVLPVCAVLGLAGLLRQGIGGQATGHGSAIRMAMPGVACGCGLLCLIPGATVASGLAVGLAVLTFVLLLPTPNHRRTPSRPSRPAAGLHRLLRSTAGTPATLAVVLAFMALFGGAAAALPDRLDGVAPPIWAAASVYAAAAMLGSGITLASLTRNGLAAGRTLLPTLVGVGLLALLSAIASAEAPVLAGAGLLSGTVAALVPGALDRAARARPGINPQQAGRQLAALGATLGLLLGALLPDDIALIWLSGGATLAAAVCAVLVRAVPLPKAPHVRR